MDESTEALREHEQNQDLNFSEGTILEPAGAAVAVLLEKRVACLPERITTAVIARPAI